MSKDILDAVFSKFLSSGLVSQFVEFLWHAGEPLALGPDYYHEAMALCQARNLRALEIRHTIQTNGVLITQAWCDLFKAYNIGIGLSLDGPQFVHDAHRKSWGGGGSWSKTVRGFELLKKNDLHPGVLCVLTARSLEHPEALYDFFSTLGVRWLAFNMEEVEGMNLASSIKSEKTAEVTDRYISFMRYFFRRWLAEGQPFRVREFDDFLSIFRTVRVDDDFFRRPDETLPMTIVTIQKNGNVSTYSPEFAGASSSRYSDFILGNILTECIDEMAAGGRLRQIAQDVDRGIRNCARLCKWFTFCGGAYVSNKFYENGNLESTQTTACRLHRIELTKLLLKEMAELQVTGKACGNA